MRLRRQVAFDRFLARMFSKGPAYPWVLKGGYLRTTQREKAKKGPGWPAESGPQFWHVLGGEWLG